MTLVAFHLSVAGLLAALAIQVALNCTRLRGLARVPEPRSSPTVAVLIPARNEAETIGESVGKWTVQEYPNYEIAIFDDDSTDGTAARAADAAVAGRVHVVRGEALPDGWRGKPHACHRLRDTTTADVLVFADADVLPEPAALARIVAAFAALGVDAVSVLPAHQSPSAVVRALVAIQNWAPLAFVPWWITALRRHPAFAVANGQLFAIRASAYDAAGGFAAVRESVGEDVALGRRLVALGYRLGCVDGGQLVRCRPYARLRDLWRANARNLTSVFFGSVPLVLFVAAALTALYVAPVVLAVVGLTRSTSTWTLTWLPLAEIALGVAPRIVADRRAGYPTWVTLAHPLAVAALVGMLLDSLVRVRWRREVEWRGRRYRVDRAA